MKQTWSKRIQNTRALLCSKFASFASWCKRGINQRSGCVLSKIEARMSNPSLNSTCCTVFTRPSKSPSLARVFWIHLLEVCWTFAGSCKHPIKARTERRNWRPTIRALAFSKRKKSAPVRRPVVNLAQRTQPMSGRNVHLASRDLARSSRLHARSIASRYTTKARARIPKWSPCRRGQWKSTVDVGRSILFMAAKISLRRQVSRLWSPDFWRSKVKSAFLSLYNLYLH